MQTIFLVLIILLDLALVWSLFTGRILISPNYNMRILDRRESPMAYWLVWAIYVIGINALFFSF